MVAGGSPKQQLTTSQKNDSMLPRRVTWHVDGARVLDSQQKISGVVITTNPNNALFWGEIPQIYRVY